MSPRLGTTKLISRGDLECLGKERQREARALLEGKCYAGAIYLGGYALESSLKVAICVRLKLSHLVSVLKTHDLVGLLLFTGLSNALEDEQSRQSSLRFIAGTWNDKDGNIAVRYSRPSSIDQTTAARFFDCLESEKHGVLPWLQKAIS